MAEAEMIGDRLSKNLLELQAAKSAIATAFEDEGECWEKLIVHHGAVFRLQKNCGVVYFEKLDAFWT